MVLRQHLIGMVVAIHLRTGIMIDCELAGSAQQLAHLSPKSNQNSKKYCLWLVLEEDVLVPGPVKSSLSHRIS